MPTDIWSIPKDPSSGNVRGSYYLRHHTEINGTLGFLAFEQGRSVRPLTGRELVTFVAALGKDCELEPADDEARAAMGVAQQDEAAQKDAPSTIPTVEPEPKSTVAEPLPDEDPDDQTTRRRRRR